MLAEVSAKLLDQFVTALEADVLADGPARPSPSEPVAVRRRPGRALRAPEVESQPAEPVDLMGTAGSSVIKRVGPVLVVLAVVAWLLRRR